MVHPGPALAGVGSGTLLGPEGSAVQSNLLVGLLFLPLLEATCWWLRVLVGLLFEICIVDASIFAAGFGWLRVCNCFRCGRLSFPWTGRAGSLTGSSFDWGWAGVFLWFCFSVCCFDVVETSYEGHMVDALASRADEGRWSLR